MKLNKRGFSLVELLGVMVILAILIGLATAAYARYRQKAKQQGYDTMAESASNAAAEYAMDNPGHSQVTFETLYKEGYLSSLQDPGRKDKNCTGNVTFTGKYNGDPGGLSTDGYYVSVCCNNYNYIYELPKGTKTKTKKCQLEVDPCSINPC